MITLSASGGSVTFTFSGNSTYLNDGTITVPVNSLALIIDESNMATFRKAASNDIFVSANIAEFGMTKAELEAWYKANMVGSTGGGSGSGVTPSEVQTMIDESISGKADSSAVTQEITAAVSGKADSSSLATVATSGSYDDLTNKPTIPTVPTSNTAFTNDAGYITSDALSGYAESSAVTEEISAAVSGKVDTTTYTAYTADTTPKVDAAWENGVKAPSLGYDTISGITLSSLPISGGDYNYSSIATDDSLKSDDESVLGVYATGDTHVVSINPTEKINTAHLGVDKKPFNIKMYWNSSYTGNTSHNIAVNCVVNDGTNGYCQWDWKNGEYVPNDKYINTAVTLTYDSTNQVVTITPSSSSALDYIRYVKCNRYIAPSSSLTQEDCRIGLVTIDSNLYKLQEALDNKQDTLSAGENITISGNVISAEGGGKAIEGGRGISVTTGETADTVSFDLPIYIGSMSTSVRENYTGNTASNHYAHAEGMNTTASGNKSHAEGYYTTASGNFSHAEGWDSQATSMGAHAEGKAAIASGMYSHAEGYYTKTNNQSEHANGEYNVSNTGASTSAQTLFSVGNGTANNARHNAFEIRKNGDIYIQSGNTDILLQDHLGGGGSLNIPISAGTGTYSIQENAGSALGGYSHAEGSNTTASGDYSHAEGYNTMAISAYSHTEGWQTEANGLAAHAEGYTTKADGENSHAEGNMTETNNLGEHASGSYNLSHKASNTFGDSGNTLFSVGNGTSTGTSRHNAFEIRQNGDIYFEYDGADTKLQDKLDEIESVTAAALNNLNSRFGGLSLVKLTQQQYDNLQTKDSNTLYVIVN